MKKEFLCHFILLSIALLVFELKTEAQVEEPDKGKEVVATIQGTVMGSEGNPIKGAIAPTAPPTPRTAMQAVTAAKNMIPEIQLKVRDSETLRTRPENLRDVLRKKWPAMLSSFTLFPVGTGITIGFAEKKFRSSAHDAKKKFLDIIPISTDDYRLRMQSWEQYQQKVTRANWLAITSGNLMLDSIPFYWHWVKGKPIGWKLALIYYGSQVVAFGSWSISDWMRTADAQNQADKLEQALRYHEATAQQGEKGKFRERAEWLAANAVLDAAFGALAWRICSQQNNEQRARKPKASVSKANSLRLHYRISSNQVALSVASTF
jgi:hypothetical protein